MYAQADSQLRLVLDNLKAKCQEIYGAKEFYARFIELDGELGSDDLTNIAALLRK